MDSRLKELINTLGEDWARLSEFFPDKTPFQIERRWVNKLNPCIKRKKWSEEEDHIVISLVRSIGPNWKEIAKHLEGRPPDLIKSHYHSKIKKVED